LIDGGSGVSGRLRLFSSELIPAATSAAVALASLAFFRAWLVFSTTMGTAGLFKLSGAALAREMDGTIPWLYITPITMLGVLGLSCLRLLVRRPGVRALYGVGLPLLSTPVLVWPANATARVTHSLIRIQMMGPTSISVTRWWWVYCVSLGVVTVLGVLDLALAVRAGRQRSH
jgi:hypothetical protein